MPKTAAAAHSKRRYVPPDTAEPKAVCLHLVRPDGKALLLLENGVWTDPGGRIAKGESLDAAAPRLLLKETGLELSRLLEIGARRIGSVYQMWSRALNEAGRSRHVEWCSGTTANSPRTRCRALYNACVGSTELRWGVAS